MATTSTGNVTNAGASSAGATALGIYFNKKVLESLQPNLYFETICDVNIMEQGNYTDRFAMFDQIATSSVTTLTEGTSPTGVAVQLTVKDIVPVQYGIKVELTDMVVLTSFADLMSNVSREVGYAMARKIDNSIQTVANAGTQVIYAGGAANRAALTAGMLLDSMLLLRASQKLALGSAPKWGDSYYRAIGTVEQIYDLKSNTGVGQWIDVRKYAQPEQIFNGEVGSMHSIRLMESPNVQTFASTVTVHPMLVAAPGGVRISYWLPGKVKNYILPPEGSVSTSNPLGQIGSVGSKVDMGGQRTQEARLVRIESAATAI